MPQRLSSTFPILVAAFLVPLAAGAQTGACGVGNVRNWCVSQDSAGVTGVSQAGDHFGGALAFGDFDGDGAGDLAVGAPGESAGGAANAGAVWVFYGSPAGLHAAREQVFDQDNLPGGDGGTETGDQFGFALAAGDVDGDGFDDLAIGSPFENQPEPGGTCGFDLSCDDVGHVNLVFGSASGLDPGRVYTLSQAGGEGGATGYSLAIGDLDGDGDGELLIGKPGSMAVSLGGTIRGGSVSVLRHNGGETLVGTGGGGPDPDSETDAQWGFAVAVGGFGPGGSAAYAAGARHSTVAGSTRTGRTSIQDGLDGENLLELAQTDYGTAGNAAEDHFGFALATGDFDGDGFDDLAAAAPEKNDAGIGDSGRVYVAYGSPSGLDPTQFQILSIVDFGGSTAATGDRLGAALAAGDYDGDGFDDLFLGSPGRGSDDRGFVYFVHGSTGGLVVGAGFVFSEPSLGGVLEEDALFGSVLAMGDLDGDGADELAIGVPEKTTGGNGSGLVYVTRQFNPNWIFGDGFESAGPTLWSATAP
jgi:hypothetical protein